MFLSQFRSQYINYNHLDQQSNHGSTGGQHHAQAHDLYVHGNNSVASGMGDPQYHTHSHLHYSEYNHYPASAQYASAGGYITEYGGGVNEHRPESPSENSGSPSPLPMVAASKQVRFHIIFPFFNCSISAAITYLCLLIVSLLVFYIDR